MKSFSKYSRDVAIKLLASRSVDIGAIAEITGLSIEELQGVKQGRGSINDVPELLNGH